MKNNIPKLFTILLWFVTYQSYSQCTTSSIPTNPVTLCGGLVFDQDQSFILQATPIGFTDATVDGDGFGSDVVEGYSPGTAFANLSGGAGFSATFGSDGNAGAMNVPGFDLYLFDAQFSVDEYVVSLMDTDGNSYGPITFTPNISCDFIGVEYVSIGNQSTFFSFPYSSFTLPLEFSSFGVPANAIISEFTLLSFQEADFIMAGIPFENNQGNSSFISNFNCTMCTAGTDAPNLNMTTISNVCPATIADLTSITASNTPPGTISLTWHTSTPATANNLVPDATMVGAGTYHAAFYDSTNECYSYSDGNGDGTTEVTVTISSPCCDAGTDAPQFGN